MEDKSIIKDFFLHMHWADAEVWKVLENSPKALNNVKIKELLYHIHLVQLLFFKVWKNEKLEYPKVEDFNSLIDIIKWSKENYIRINQYIKNLSEDEYNNITKIPWAKILEEKFGKKPEDVTKKGTMLQVILHSTYHRAQINMKLRELDYAPPPTDYIYWLWIGKPTIK